MSTKTFSTEELISISIEVQSLAKAVGSFIRKESKNFDVTKIEYKGINDLVSYVDKESEKMLVKGLQLIIPQAGFITEEGTVEQQQQELQWIIDPLDGTTNFLHGLPIFSISIALRQNNGLLVGVVYEPNRNEWFHAVKNGGAYCNNKKITVSQFSELNKSLIVTGFPYSLLDKAENYMKIFSHFAQSTHGLRRLGSAAVDLAYVAAGRFEGYYEFNLKLWDVAAGILLVQEAGGKVTDFSGGDNYSSGKEVVAAGAAHSEVLKVIKKYWQ